VRRSFIWIWLIWPRPSAPLSDSSIPVRPLSDVRILDLTRLLPGPFASLVLADLGATVDKVEDTGGGDYLRHMPPHVAGANVAFQMLNRGKRSLVLDLKAPAGRDALLQILPRYDVLFEQFRPGVLDRLGLGPDVLQERHPGLVVCSLTGYGQTGPLKAKAGHDLNYLARAGVLSFQGPPSGPPAVPTFQIADVSGGMWCVIAILAALTERARTKRGAVLDIAMADGVLGFATTSLGAALAGERCAPGSEVLNGGIAPYNTYLSKDGAPITLGALEPKFWTTFCAAVGLEPSMSDLLPGRHQVELKQKVAEAFAAKTREEWIAFAASHDCAVEPVLTGDELRDDPHVRARELLFDLDTAGGAVPQFRTPVTPKDGSFSPPPRSGEHTREVLRDGGLSDGEIDALVSAGVARDGA
jgi:alpha-methylacyl-CoA racemase